MGEVKKSIGKYVLELKEGRIEYVLKLQGLEFDSRIYKKKKLVEAFHSFSTIEDVLDYIIQRKKETM